jgi:hypothetical protein
MAADYLKVALARLRWHEFIEAGGGGPAGDCRMGRHPAKHASEPQTELGRSVHHGERPTRK